MYLPIYNGHTAVFTCVRKHYFHLERLTKYCRLIPCLVGEGALSAFLVAKLFFDNVVKFLIILVEVISDRDPRFTAFFW